MSPDERDQLELQVIQDVLDTVEAKLRERERCGWQLTVSRMRIYATILHAVIVSARATHSHPTTLDRADILDAIFDGIEPADSDSAGQLVEDIIDRNILPASRSRRHRGRPSMSDGSSTAARVEAVVVRDPDGPTDVRIFVDGMEVPATLFPVDAGAGWTWAEWMRTRDVNLALASPAARAALLHIYANVPGERYIGRV
ncbi:hypothetical protein IU474_17690 [Nocardia otitidiscaviarum]|uniref:hypothetical protein n=1 Tax=Nocardia otitidiscaviarum TaxID=1823 RepID=UPI0018934261|nr:hypothetical protein [Nocardia otitidiscaviarum]MBF6238887.1 hypothetical protein [Nocardia otitidiscaviarum]